MKKRSKILASLVLAGTMVLGLAGCGDSGSANGGTQSGKNSDAKYQVGICQLVQHEALDAATSNVPTTDMYSVSQVPLINMLEYFCARNTIHSNELLGLLIIILLPHFYLSNPQLTPVYQTIVG